MSSRCPAQAQLTSACGKCVGSAIARPVPDFNAGNRTLAGTFQLKALRDASHGQAICGGAFEAVSIGILCQSCLQPCPHVGDP